METGEEDPSFGWPIACLQQIAGYISAADTYVAPGQTVSFTNPPEPFAHGTKLCAILIRRPRLAPKGFETLKVGKGKAIHFYAVIPIYQDEFQLCQEKGSGALQRLLDEQGVTELLDVHRPSVLGA